VVYVCVVCVLHMVCVCIVGVCIVGVCIYGICINVAGGVT
jgi:hypothetical protein